MRTNIWLADRLHQIQKNNFADVLVENTILVRFGRSSKTRFGSIIARPRTGYSQPVTYITINSLFQDVSVPEFVIDATLAHEFTHYCHGFHSPLDQLYKYPHRGGIVNKEIKTRGLGEILEQQRVWIKTEYPNFLRKHNLI